jgi:hypothetical protein
MSARVFDVSHNVVLCQSDCVAGINTGTLSNVSQSQASLEVQVLATNGPSSLLNISLTILPST